MRPRSWALAALLLLVHSPTAVRGVSSLAKWDCKGFLDSAQLSFPVQYMQCGGTDSSFNCYGDSTGTVLGHGWFALDMSTNPIGYTAVFAFPRTLAAAGNAYPYIHEMNGAGLSPIDSYVYALVKVQVDSSTIKNRLIRFGSVHADRTNPTDPVLCDPARQWVASVSAFSDEYGGGWSAVEVVGAPDVYPEYGDLTGSWTVPVASDNIEWLELEFATAIQVGILEVYETNMPGRLVRVQTRDPSGAWDTVWSGEAEDPSSFSAARIFAPPLESRSYATQHVRLEVDFVTTSAYYEIDAVAVIPAGAGCSTATSSAPAFEYVANSPFSVSAGFMPNGDFHFALNTNSIRFFRGSMRPDRLTGFSSPTDPGIPAQGGFEFTYASGPFSGATWHKMSDLVGYERGGRTYGIFYRNQQTGDGSSDQMGVYRMQSDGSFDAFKLYEVVWIPSTQSKSDRGYPTSGMGALWSFQNKIIGQSGDAVYQLDVASFDFDDSSSTTVKVYFLSAAVEAAKNDGVNCFLEKNPWQPCPQNSDSETPDPQDCECIEGYTGPNGGTGPCTACAEGKIKATAGNATCSSCPSGKVSWPRGGGGTRCVCNTPRPSWVCGCHESIWRESRDPEHVPTFVKVGVDLAYSGGLSSFLADQDIQVKFREAFAAVIMPGDTYGMWRIHNTSITGSTCGGASTIGIEVYIRPRIKTAPPHMEMHLASAEPARALMANSTFALRALNDQLTSRGLPQLCAINSDPEFFSFGSNLDIWIAGLFGYPQCFFPQDNDPSDCFDTTSGPPVYFKVPGSGDGCVTEAEWNCFLIWEGAKVGVDLTRLYPYHDIADMDGDTACMTEDEFNVFFDALGEPQTEM